MNYSIPIEYLILLIEVVNGANIILAPYKLHWERQLNVQAMDIFTSTLLTRSSHFEHQQSNHFFVK